MTSPSNSQLPKELSKGEQELVPSEQTGLEEIEVPVQQIPESGEEDRSVTKKPLTAKQALKLDTTTSTKACEQCDYTLHSMRTSVLLAALASLAVVNGAVRKFTFVNKCPEPVWPGFQNSGGDKLTTSSGDARMGFSLESGSTKNVNVPNNWSGRVWGRTGCKLQGGVFTCGTGNCGGTDESCVDGNQLATLAEFTLVLADSLEPDNYDISLVDGEGVHQGVWYS
ncbi:hypothetical protein QFC19_001201 [Naganishia cerealis]|uniref:Uncharacterized protein n=1 Tax=Naganishia cerealis TaxID=610337 RepID=A0ACC2WK39_9TREE|nr:hypothetical protein QFC19_001201 [Naganishia cerealis]